MSVKKFNPKKYIIERARKLPIFKCLIVDDYSDGGLTNLLIIRKQPGGKYTFAFFLVDRYCLGVKDAFSNSNVDKHQIDELTDRLASFGEIEEVSPIYFHNLIYAALDYAEELGFKPHKDFKLAEYVLDPELIDDGIDDVEVGKEGKPFFVPGPHDDIKKIISTLNKSVGDGNYEIVVPY